MPGEDHVYMGSVMCGRRQGFRNFVMHWQRFVRDYLRLERAEFHKGRIRSFFGDEDMRNRR